MWHGYFGSYGSAPKWHLEQFSCFLHSSSMCPTHRQTNIHATLHATSVARRRIYKLHAGNVANNKIQQVRPSLGTAVYPHMPRACPARSPSVKGTGVYQQYMPLVSDWSDFGLLREQSSPKWEILCPARPWTTVQNLTPLAFSSPEKSVNVHTHTHTHTNSNNISTPCLLACVDNNSHDNL